MSKAQLTLSGDPLHAISTNVPSNGRHRRISVPERDLIKRPGVSQRQVMCRQLKVALLAFLMSLSSLSVDLLVYGQIGHGIFDLEYPFSCLRVESRIDRSPNDWPKESRRPGQSRIIA